MVTMVSFPDSFDDGTPSLTGSTGSPPGRWHPPNRCNPDQVVLPDGRLLCSDWCQDGTGHPEATDPSEQICVSAQFRLTPAAGGGRTGHARPAGCQCGTIADCPEIPSADATLIAHGSQFPGEPAGIVLAIDTAGSEHHIHLSLPETDQLTAALHTLGFRLEGVPA